MAILKGILGESLEYYQDLVRRYQARLKELPPGSILKRRIGGREYYYRVYREGARIVSKYLGKAVPEQMHKQIEERRQIKRQLKEVQEDLRILQRVTALTKDRVLAKKGWRAHLDQPGKAVPARDYFRKRGKHA